MLTIARHFSLDLLEGSRLSPSAVCNNAPYRSRLNDALRAPILLRVKSFALTRQFFHLLGWLESLAQRLILFQHLENL